MYSAYFDMHKLSHNSFRNIPSKSDKFKTLKVQIVLCIIPGQSPSSQSLNWLSLTPTIEGKQVSPTGVRVYSGLGHIRVLNEPPCPHVAEHAPNALHSPH